MATYIKEHWWQCDECGELFEGEHDAVDCCPTPANSVDVFVCDECDHAYLEEVDALNCCLDEGEE